MQIIVEVPGKFPDAVHCTPQQFEREAKMAMAVKLYEMKRLSSPKKMAAFPEKNDHFEFWLPSTDSNRGQSG
jgi:hypothetical protein